ncbi:MAG: DNA translocase FtsK 4TM domain-containing protein, partial [Clostridia bacterium]|nr:DNA translocase FtsK 4TM domain-containing protein [Clostridia bacterium]
MKKNQADIETTKLGNTVQTDKKRKTKSKKEGTEPTAEPDGKKRDYKEIVRFIIGLILLVISLLLFISFTSFLISGKEDMVLLEQGVIEKYSNWTGCIGARCANYFINRCFGFSAFFIPVLLLAIAMKLTRAYKIR